MNGLCKILDCFYGAAPTSDDEREWVAIKVDRAGNITTLSGAVDTEEEAEQIAKAEHVADLENNGQFGVGA